LGPGRRQLPDDALTSVVDVDPVLVEPPINVMRVGLHPRGLAPLMVNLGDRLRTGSSGSSGSSRSPAMKSSLR
jgi:hypothetical protein